MANVGDNYAIMQVRLNKKTGNMDNKEITKKYHL